MSVVLPDHFLRLAEQDQGWADWLAGLPRLIRDSLSGWQLTPVGEVRTGQAAAVIPVRTADGSRAALKFGWPHPEAEHEHLALRAWDSSGAVRLLRADPRRSVLLLEWADPDRDLGTVGVIEACQVIAGLYRSLHRPAIPQLARLSDQAARWSAELAGLREHPLVPRRYVEQAGALAADLATDPGTDGTLLHTDLHYANVLAADREPWLAIDPKPLSGDPAYEIAPVLWNRWEEATATGNLRAAILDRFYAVVDAAELDEERARSWVVVREMVNIMFALRKFAERGTLDSGWITAAMTIVKAVQR